jgi:hypothetical protein
MLIGLHGTLRAVSKGHKLLPKFVPLPKFMPHDLELRQLQMHKLLKRTDRAKARCFNASFPVLTP